MELACAYAACEVARSCAAQAFRERKRAMLAGDVLDAVGSVFDKLFPIFDVVQEQEAADRLRRG